MKLNCLLTIIEKNPLITEKELSSIFGVHERTIRRYIKTFKEANILSLEKHGKNKIWIIKKWFF